MDTPSGQPADIRTVRQILDSALAGLSTIESPSPVLKPAHDALGEAIRLTYEAMRQTGDQHGFQQCTAGALEQTREALTLLQGESWEDAKAERTMQWVAHALRRLRDVRIVIHDDGPPVPPPDGPARATVGRPTLQRPPRAAVAAAIPLLASDEEPPEKLESLSIPTGPRSIEDVEAMIAELKAQAAALEGEEDAADDDGQKDRDPEEKNASPPPDDVLFGAAVEEAALLRARAAELTGDLGMMGRMRMPEPEHSWLHGDETERRLLTRVDALVACGAWVVPQMVDELADSPIPDAPLTWATLFFLGSLDGRDSLDQIFRVLEACDFEDEMLGDELTRYAANALALAPHHGLVERLKPWLSDPRDVRRRIAVEALSQRKALTPHELHHLTQDATVDIAELAAKGLGLHDGPLPVGTFASVLQDSRPRVLRAAIGSALRHRRASGVDRIFELFQPEAEPELELPRFMAIVAERDTGYEAFLGMGADLDTVAVMDGLGWFGHPGFIEFLIGRLDSETPGVPMAAIGALERITGARMLAEDTDPEYADDDYPFEREWAPPVVIPDPCLDADLWKAWWSKHKHRAQMDKRYRYGHLWEPRDCAWALSDEITTIAEREFVHLELCIRTGGTYGLEPDRFVVPQQGLVQLWWDHVTRGCQDIEPGTWPVRPQR